MSSAPHTFRTTRKLLVSLFALIALVVAPVAASAHAGLVSANPEANKEITAMPQEIVLTFTEDLMVLGEADVNSISMNLLDGAEVPLTDIKVNGATLSATVPEGNYESGTYEVFYTIVSADGHKLSDSYAFSLNAPTLLIAPAPAKESHGVIPLPIVGAIAMVIALAGLFIYRSRKS
jgi:methionine-rich copper-binding protein CopC